MGSSDHTSTGITLETRDRLAVRHRGGGVQAGGVAAGHHAPAGSMTNAPKAFHDPTGDDDLNLSGAGATTNLGTFNGLTDAMYLREAGSAQAVSMGDISQGSVSDCFLLSALDEIARQSVIQDDPSFLPSMIYQNANGTETVHLFQQIGTPGGALNFTSKWTQVNVTVDNDFISDGVNAQAGQAQSGSQKEIWPSVIEKAVSTLWGGYPSSVQDGGVPLVAMEAMTGQAGFLASPLGLTAATLASWTNNNDLITFDTTYADSTYNLIGDHSYAFAGYDGSGPTEKIKLQNPWGFDQPSEVPLSAIAAGMTQIDRLCVGHFYRGAGDGGHLVG